MKVKVMNETKELLVQTVSLSINEEDPDNMWLFRCPYCSKGISRIRGDVESIVEGLTPTLEVPVLQDCPRCNRLYTFQTVRTHRKHTDAILIGHEGRIGVFYCWKCRNPLVQFINGKVMRLPDLTLVDVPFSMKCVNPTCETEYTFRDII